MKNINKLPILNLLLFLAVVTVNALANILPINGYNTGELSDMLPNLFVPAGITFSIWAIIYLTLAILVINLLVHMFRKKTVNVKTFNIYLSLNFILNISWILVWHYRLITISLIVMLGIFYTLYKLDNEILKISNKNTKLISSITIGIYFGWISVALIANVTAFFVNLGWDGTPLTEEVWTVIVISIGAIIAILKVLKSKNIFYPLVFIWAFIGIIIKRSETIPLYNSIIIISYISIALISIAILTSVLRKKKK